mmetsp:Transcript_22692/g.31737  ORF Transcript_22692/g.31737 Transcript_22692/m.31737 type:complete len:202 (+) Transcript_22692:177-782(+)
MFRIPILREYFLLTGHVDASRKNVDTLLANRKTIAIVIGGEAEVLQTENSKEKVVILGRYGFVEMAIKHGASLVPTYSFGVNDTFTIDKSTGFWIRNKIQRLLKLAIPIFWGRWGTSMPHKKKVYFAVGNPIDIPLGKGVDEDGSLDPVFVAQIHKKYVEALKNLFEEHKAAAGYPDRELELLEAPKRRKRRGTSEIKKAA